MSTYVPVKRLLPTGLDEIGLELGLQRLPNETLDNYKRRLALEAKQPNGPTQRDFINSAGRQVGIFDTPVFSIDLVLDGNGQPIAADPFIEITSTVFRAYDDYANDSVDIELNLFDKTNGWFLRDIYNDLVASSYFDVTVLDSSYTYKTSKNLKFSNSLEVKQEILRSSRSYKLEKGYIKDIYVEETDLFTTEVGSESAITERGEYFVDYTNGVIFTFDLMSGSCQYEYRAFPMTLFYQPVRAWPLVDTDKNQRFYDVEIDHVSGAAEHRVLNSAGAVVYNEVLHTHPLSWGK